MQASGCSRRRKSCRPIRLGLRTFALRKRLVAVRNVLCAWVPTRTRKAGDEEFDVLKTIRFCGFGYGGAEQRLLRSVYENTVSFFLKTHVTMSTEGSGIAWAVGSEYPPAPKNE